MTSCELILIRHAIAEERRIGLPEADRALTPRGIERFRALARGYKHLKLQPKTIWTSPWQRAHHTAELLSETFPHADREEKVELAAPPTHALVEAMHEGLSPLILVGHEPWLTELAGLLTIGQLESSIRLKKGGLIWLSGIPEAAGMFTKLVLAPATTLKLLDTRG